MKTAIAVPDAVFLEVEARVKALGMSRSEFYSTAARRYLAELDRTDLRARIDSALEFSGGDADASRNTELGRLRLEELTVDDEW